MPTVPKRATIQVNTENGAPPILIIGSDDRASDTFSVHAYISSLHAYLHVRDPHAAREYAQMLRGAAEALVDWALTQEQPANFAAAEATP